MSKQIFHSKNLKFKINIQNPTLTFAEKCHRLPKSQQKTNIDYIKMKFLYQVSEIGVKEGHEECV